MRKWICSVVCLLLMLPMGAWAGSIVESKILREGLFENAGCASESGCFCKEESVYPHITLSGSVSDKLNKTIKALREKLYQHCNGARVADSRGEAVNKLSNSYTILYEDEQVLSVHLASSFYTAGAAHPGSSGSVYTFAIKSGEVIEPLAGLSTDKVKKISDFLNKENLKVDADCRQCAIYWGGKNWLLHMYSYGYGGGYAQGGGDPFSIPIDLLPAPQIVTLAKENPHAR